MTKLRRLPDDGRLYSNACHNRMQAMKMAEAGFTAKEIAGAFPRVWACTAEGKLRQKYDSEYADGRKETRVMMSSAEVERMIREKS